MQETAAHVAAVSLRHYSRHPATAETKGHNMTNTRSTSAWYATRTPEALLADTLAYNFSKLPANADDIATFLNDREVKGNGDSSDSHPLAVFLAARCSGEVVLSDCHCTLRRNNHEAELSLPTPLCIFVQRFDAGDYTKLYGTPSAGTTGPLPIPTRRTQA